MLQRDWVAHSCFAGLKKALKGHYYTSLAIIVQLPQKVDTKWAIFEKIENEAWKAGFLRFRRQGHLDTPWRCRILGRKPIFCVLIENDEFLFFT